MITKRYLMGTVYKRRNQHKAHTWRKQQQDKELKVLERIAAETTRGLHIFYQQNHFLRFCCCWVYYLSYKNRA